MCFKISILLIALTVLPVPFVSAEETVGDYMVGIGTKFGRGLENIVTSFAEVPCTVHADMKDQGGSGFFPGLGMGTVYMLRRMFIADDAGHHDHLMQFSHPVTGSSFFVPSVELLQGLAG